MTPPVTLPCGCVVGVGGEPCSESERLLNRAKRAYRKWAANGSDAANYAAYDATRSDWWRHVTAEEQANNARE